MSDDVTMYRLVVLKGADPGFRTVIREGSVLVGRDEKCRVCLPDPDLAPQHLALRRQDGRVVAQALEGTGEVLLQGEALTEAVLEHGNVLDIGALRLEYQVVRPLPFHETRSAGTVYRVARAALAGVIVLQVLLLGWLWYTGPEQLGVQGIAGEGWESDRDLLTNDLASAHTRSEDPGARQVDRSPEDLWASGGSQDLAREIDQVRARVAELDTTLQAMETPGQAVSDPLRNDTAKRAQTTPSDAQRREEERRLAAEQAATEQAAAEQAAQERAAQEKAALEKAAREKAERERVAQEKADREKAEALRLVGLAEERERTRDQVAQTPKVVQIEDVRREKFQNRENYEEIRLVRIELKRRKSGGPVLHDRLRIEVQFYDKESATGEILPSQVPAPRKGLDLSEDWSDGGTHSFSALYMVPRDFRDNEYARTGRHLQFHGYVVRVLYDGQLQDEHAFPSGLLP